MDRFHVWTGRFAYTSLCATVALGLWLLFSVDSRTSMNVGAVLWISCFLGFEMCLVHLDSRNPMSKEQQIRIRIAELEKGIVSGEAKVARYRVELETLQTDTHIYGGEENIALYPQRERKILDKIEAVDREIDPKLMRRAKLRQDLDELQQKKAYRG
jgi:hypothetical protein